MNRTIVHGWKLPSKLVSSRITQPYYTWLNKRKVHCRVAKNVAKKVTFSSLPFFVKAMRSHVKGERFDLVILYLATFGLQSRCNISLQSPVLALKTWEVNRCTPTKNGKHHCNISVERVLNNPFLLSVGYMLCTNTDCDRENSIVLRNMTQRKITSMVRILISRRVVLAWHR